jgi:hypothetical protein
MTYREHMHALAVAMSDLLRDGGQVAPADLDLALTAHATVVQLLQTMHRDVTGIAHSPEPANLGGLERHPVAVLGRVLRNQPQLASVALSDVAAAVGDPAANAWRDVARHAAVAAHDWQTATPGSRPRGEAAWSEIADVAALSESVAVLTQDLAAVAARTDRRGLADRLSDAATSGLAPAAVAVRTLAESGPTPRGGETVPTPTRLILRVRVPEHLPAGLDRLAHLIRTSSAISPIHLQLVARVLGAAARASGDALADAGHAFDTAARSLREHAGALLAVASAPHRVVILEPSDPGALAQAQQLLDKLRDAARSGQPLPAALARDIGRAASEATAALATAVDDQVRTRRWLTPSEAAEPHELAWTPVVAGPPEPELVRATWNARATATAALAELRTDGQPTRWASPREVLAKALASRTAATATTRPLHPRTAPRRG